MPDEVSATSMDAPLRAARMTFAAKVRAARAVLGLKQSELAKRAGLTQKSIHRIEQGADYPRRSTIIALEQVLKAEGIEFEEMPGAALRLWLPRAPCPSFDRRRPSAGLTPGFRNLP